MLNAIVIDDELEARTLLKYEIAAHCPDLVVVAEAETVEQAVKVIEQHLPDLIFLDVKLSDGVGFDVLEKIAEQDIKVIFTTAYSKYALKAIKFSALDYLLKPIDGLELQQAVSKLQNIKENDYRKNLNSFITNKTLEGNKKKIALSTSKGVMVTSVEDIIYLQSERNYTRIYTSAKYPLLISKPLKDFEEMLSPHGFERIHTSYLINLNHLVQYDNKEGGFVTLGNNIQLPVARRKRASLLKTLNLLND